MERTPSLQNQPEPRPLYRNGSVESVRRQLVNRGYADYYQAHPVGVGVNLKGLERKPEPGIPPSGLPQSKKPPLPYRNERPPHYPQMYQIGRAS